jgi:hypothetical protein
MQTGAHIRFFSGNAVMIFRFNDNDKAIEVLLDSGVKLLDTTKFGILETDK